MSFLPITSNFEFNKFAFLLSKYDYKVKQNDILAGVIIGLEPNYALIDIGLKQIAFLPLEEIYIHSVKSPNKILKLNLIGEFLILLIQNKNKKLIISLKQLHSLYLWERIKQINFTTSIIYTRIEQSLGRGKILNFNGLKLFALNLHIPKHYRRKKDHNVFLPVKFIELKDFIHTGHVNARLALFNKLSSLIYLNQTYCGNIIAVKKFGIFINIFGLQCLLHISEISRQKIKNLIFLYYPGQEVKVKILYKDLEQGKISLTLKT